MSKYSEHASGPSDMEYYQIGGFGCSVNNPGNHPGSGGWLTTKQLAVMVFDLDIARKTGVDLVFGVTPCGAAYLLVPRTPALDRTRFGSRRVYVANGFISLSPAHFNSVDELKYRLDELENKPNKRKDRGPPTDRSRMNKGFTQSGSPVNIVSKPGKDRALFEHQRLLVRLSREEPDIDYWNFAIDPPKWRHRFRVVSFSYNRWSADHRSKFTRGDDLKILDVGWTEFAFRDFVAQATTHAKIEENVLLNNKNPSKFLHGETKVLGTATVQSQLQAMFAAEEEQEARPILLLVSNIEDSIHALRVLGVYTGSWHRGIEPILGLTPLTEGMEFAKRTKSGDPYARRSRDLSPSRDSKKRARSPLRASKTPYPVYVVDVSDMYRLAIGEPAAAADVLTMAARFRVDSTGGNTGGKLGWCAGNESRLLGTVWHKMATGNALEEQKTEWQKRVSHEDTRPPLASGSGGRADSDDELDPNDPAPSRPVQPTYVKAKNPYEALEDDDDDW